MFSEAAWSVFRSSGEVGEPGDLSRFSLSYPIAIPICRPMTKTLTPIGANEAVFGVPSGQVLRVGGVAAQFVALSNKVDAQLSSLKTAIGTAATAEGVAAGLNGMSSLNSALSGWPQGTGATKLKAE
jgi:hypothetical protein